MTSRSLCIPLLSLALTGSLALAQQTTPAQTAAPPDAAATPSTPRPPRSNMQRGPGGQGMTMRGRDRGDDFGGRDRGFRMGPGGMWWKDSRVVQNLSLTPDQVKKMDGIFQESRLKLIDLHANVQKQEVMLEPLLSANPLDTAKAQAQIDKVADARAELEKTNARMLLSLRGVLTPDQWTKLQERRGPGEPAVPGADGGPGGGRGRGPQPAGVDNLVEPPLEP